MQFHRHRLLLVASFVLGLSFSLLASQDQSMSVQQEAASGIGSSVRPRSDYVLGPDDEIAIRALDAEEISNKPMRIDGTGNINIPMLGRIRAAGLTVRALEGEIEAKLAAYVIEPEVSIFITAYRSQPVSVIGSVNRPGTLQLEGHKTLIEVLSLAGGLSGDAGNLLKITRRAEWGRIPLPNSTVDESAGYSIAEVGLRSLMEARNPEENIMIMPNDVLSVPRGQMVYVIGQVNKPGGFVLAEREATSVIHAIAMAQGLALDAASKDARIIRPVVGASRIEIAVNLKDILDGKEEDVAMQPEDILFVPNSYAKSAWRRTLNAVIQAGTGIAIYRRW